MCNLSSVGSFSWMHFNIVQSFLFFSIVLHLGPLRTLILSQKIFHSKMLALSSSLIFEIALELHHLAPISNCCRSLIKDLGFASTFILFHNSLKEKVWLRISVGSITLFSVRPFFANKSTSLFYWSPALALAFTKLSRNSLVLIISTIFAKSSMVLNLYHCLILLTFSPFLIPVIVAALSE